MRIALGADHRGFELGRQLSAMLCEAGHEVVAVGPRQAESGDDYPDRAREVCGAVLDGRAERGMVICGSGVGACVAANKIAGIRAGMCHDTYSAHQGVEHDDMNVLCLGALVIGSAAAGEVARAFVGAQFTGAARHLRRLKKVEALEGKAACGPAR